MAATYSGQMPPTPDSMDAEFDLPIRKKLESYDYDSDDEETIKKLIDSFEPLSSLPTPPPSDATSPNSRRSSLNSCISYDDVVVDRNFKERWGYEAERTSYQLVKFMRVGKGVKRPDAYSIEVFLKTFRCHQTTIAHAACILNSLSWRFNAEWLTAMDSIQDCQSSSSCSHDDNEPATRHTELIIAAALDLSGNWLVDDWYPFGRKFTERCLKYCPRMLQATKTCILQDQNVQWNLMQFDLAEVHEWQERIFGDDACIQSEGAAA